MSFFLPRPTGELTIEIGNQTTHECNLFTNYGIHQIYGGGKRVVIDSNGGMFESCVIGRGEVPLTTGSTTLSETIPMTSTQVSTDLTTFVSDGLEYAKGIFVYEFDGEYIGNITEVMLTDTIGGSMMCGKTLDVPIPIIRGDTIRITYCVTIPIYTNALISSGMSDGTQFYLRCDMFTLTPTSLISILPTQSPQQSVGNISRIYDEGVLLGEGDTRYECNITTSDGLIQYNVNVGVYGNRPESYVKELCFGNSDPSTLDIDNFPFVFEYGTRVFRSYEIDWTLEFTMKLEIPNVY